MNDFNYRGDEFMIVDHFSITELSNLTNKSRPTLYKYISSYETGDLNEVPYNFILLFNLINKPGVKKKEIVAFCEENFIMVDTNKKVNTIITLIKENKNVLDLDILETFIEEEIKKCKK